MSGLSASIVGFSKKPLWIAAILAAAALSVLVAFPASWDAKFSVLAGGLCAQQPSHSFFLAGTQLPLDARCTGMYTGFAIAFFYLLLIGRGKAMYFPPLPLLVFVGALVAVMGLDGLNSFVKDLRVAPLYPPDNRLRLATGLGTGLAMAVLLLPVLNSTVWRRPRKRRLLRSPVELGVLLLLLLVFYLFVVSGFGPLLYPVSLFSTVGVLLTVSVLNLMPVVAIAGKEGKFAGAADLLPFWGAALLLAALELTAMSIFKTWAYTTLGITLI